MEIIIRKNGKKGEENVRKIQIVYAAFSSEFKNVKRLYYKIYSINTHTFAQFRSRRFQVQ